ncbi:hypothetical protein JTE90_021409 [Oedothorax gibbosus]|uniref:Uncharacterized protein n=1 Tax=Oedothorax gibbosus TaxID=931172 RepID=A0AAV6VFV2_9ARAC|nr:hypothetical protein JTE90_021409 [Oedothorax gibbosus]
MFLRNIPDQQSGLEGECDENVDKSPNPEQSVVFPYRGPPGSGPGLLGSKPGAVKLEYLIALEHYAASLKSALIIAATLKNEKNKDLDIDMVYNSICAIENEFQNQNGARISQ